MRRRDGVRRVFLATDDATLGHDIKAYRTVEWIFDEDEYRVANGSGLLHQQVFNCWWAPAVAMATD